MINIVSNTEPERISELLKKLPPNCPVGILYVNGAEMPVASFSNYSNGLAYFVSLDSQICIVNGDRIDGIIFGVAEPFEEFEDDFE